jgi:hypothetical protein
VGVAVVTEAMTNLSFDQLVRPARLQTTWKSLRAEIKKLAIRDIVDHADLAVALDSTLAELSAALIDGTYEPSAPSRYELAKGKGSFRVMTLPDMRDAIVYRLICDTALKQAIPSQVAGAYFSRRHTATPVGRSLSGPLDDADYAKFWDIWLRYQQYRTRTLVSGLHEVLVVTDISNYFESVSHELLMEYLAPLGLPRMAVGLLGRLLEALKPPTGHSPNPRIGLPVDEIDCSRQLAHVFLFEHDRRVADEFGEDSYVRWMDDQNVGVASLTEARQVVNAMTRSLSQQRLTLSAAKTKFLQPADVATEFQLEANERLDAFEDNHGGKFKVGPEAKAAFEFLWAELLEAESVGQGHWDKIIKRAYGLATAVDSPVMEANVWADIVEKPDLATPVFKYLSLRNQGERLLELFARLLAEGESQYESTEALAFEALMLSNLNPEIEAGVRDLALRFVRGDAGGQTNRPFGKVSAMLAAYWCGANPEDLRGCLLDTPAARIPAPLARSWMAITFASSPGTLVDVQRHLVGCRSDDVARLSAFLDGVAAGRISSLGNYRAQKSKWPLPGSFYDSRMWLQLEVSSHGEAALRARAKTDLTSHFAKLASTVQERRVAARVANTLG